MRPSKFSEQQIIGFLKEHEAGKPAKEVARAAGITEHSFYRWKAKYGGMDVSQVVDKKRLEDENRKLKQLGADVRAISALDLLHDDCENSSS